MPHNRAASYGPLTHGPLVLADSDRLARAVDAARRLRSADTATTSHCGKDTTWAIYLSMQRVRFSSPDAYEKFKVVFADTRNHLMTLPGFLHLTWWEHPDDPGWFNEISMWASEEALRDWHMNTYHKYAKAWAANGAIMEDIINNFELTSTRLLRDLPVLR